MENDEVLDRFMQEFFPFDEFVKTGLFKKEMKGDYKAQADKICEYFGLKTIYEYGAIEVRCHVSYSNPQIGDPFVVEIPSIYD